ncbi:hypothetical protein [Marinilactibacillus kalidii]|uniref:hypothetical protein n=1 Tax=Marinilactibacillus kalidii TaxID=2820274 RepID=UPI001ABEE608|nr:hypothetical protein [Marinilactibacillus kalidii]
MKMINIFFQYLLSVLLSLMICNAVRNIDDSSLLNVFIGIFTISFVTISSMVISRYINIKTGEFSSDFFNPFPLFIGILMAGATLNMFFPDLVSL